MSVSTPTTTTTPPHLHPAVTTTTEATAKTTITPPSVSISLSGVGSAASASVSASAASASCGGSSSNNSIKDSSSSCSPRVVFGAGAVTRLPTELGRLRLTSPLIVSSPSRISLARRVQALVPNLDSRILDAALVNVPPRIVDDAVGRISGRDCVISVGGTSAVKLAKAIGMRKKIPHICIPTTYSGSEMPMLGDLKRRSRSRRHRSEHSSSGSSKHSSDLDSHIMPTIVIYDEDLTSNSASMTISAPNDATSLAESRCRRSSNDDDAQWSYIHLPGV